MDTKSETKKVGAALVLGGGVGGIQASLDLAESGFLVYLGKSSPAIGGVMAQLDKTFTTNDCSMCILWPWNEYKLTPSAQVGYRQGKLSVDGVEVFF